MSARVLPEFEATPKVGSRIRLDAYDDRVWLVWAIEGARVVLCACDGSRVTRETSLVDLVWNEVKP